MSKKIDLRIFRGNTVYQSIPGTNGISRMYRWVPEKNRYETPLRGKSYQASRYVLKDEQRTRQFKMFLSLEEARTWQSERQIVVTNASVTALPVVTQGVSLRDVADLWRNSIASKSVGTQIYYGRLAKMLDPIMNVQMTKLSPQIVDDLIAEWKKMRVSKRRFSFHRELDTLNLLIHWYVENFDDATSISPVKARHWDMSLIDKAKTFKKCFMEEDEYAAFLDSIYRIGGDMWRALALTQGRHFMRISEAAAMKWLHFDPTKKSYFLCEHAIWPRNNIDPSCIVPGTKSRKAHEPFSIALFSEVVKALQKLDCINSSELIFTEDGSLMNYRRIQHMYDKAFRNAGLDFSGTHVLRHTGATLFQHYSDGDKLALQSQGGWKTSRQPEHYAKILSTRGRIAVDEIERKSAIK